MPHSQYDTWRLQQRLPHRGVHYTSVASSRERLSDSQSHFLNTGQPSSFVEDRRGDPQNLTYGSLDRHAVPRYRPAGHGGLLGLGPNYRITSRSEARLEVENMELDSTRKSRKQSLLSNFAGKDQAAINIAPGVSGEHDLHKDFLRFEHGRPRKRRRLSAEPLQDGAEADDSDGSDLEVEEIPNAEDAFDAFKRDPIHQRHLELSKATEERPNDASGWLALIGHQAGLLDNKHGVSLSSRNLIELKISLYEQALSRVNAREGRHALILGLMREGRAVWDADKQATRWQAFLDDDASFDLWKLYINFIQSNLVKFTYEACMKIYGKWLQIFQDTPPSRLRDSSCIYILLRLTLFLWQCGFIERAIGTWQALLEYNYFRPHHIQPAEAVPSFEDFWASEVARIGEEGSTGWGSTTSAELEPKIDESCQSQTVNFGQWAAAEMELGRTVGLPARALDEVSEDDPYRVLVFSDVKEFIFSPTTEDGFRLLADAFLLFAGLPAVSSFQDVRAWKGDPFICSQSLAGSNFTQSSGHGDRNFGTSVSFEAVFFAAKQWISEATEASQFIAERVVHLYPTFVRRVVSQLAGLPSLGGLGESMMEYAVALEAGIDLKSARKQAKSFLKGRTDSLRLYDAYALLECQLGNFEVAEKVWSTALSMRQSLHQDAQVEAFFLWRNWAYSYMCRGEFNRARTLLTMITVDQLDWAQLQPENAVNSIPSAAAQIKVERHLKLQIEAICSKNQRELLKVIIDGLAFHKYLNSGLRLEVALEAYSGALKLFPGLSTVDSDVIEAVHEQRARFMYAHAVTFRQNFKPKELIATLGKSVQAFPDNFLLLTLNHYFTQQAGVIDRLRQVDGTAREQQESGEEESVIPCLFDILVERNRPSYSGSTSHSIRSAFRRATEVGCPGHDSIEIWKAYVLWETSLISADGKPEPGRNDTYTKERKIPDRVAMAVQALYASLRACPWSKDLCMLGFTQPLLRDAVGNEGLKQVYQSMLDRGMRLHIDVSDNLL